MIFETLAEHVKEVWLGDLIEASLCARREQLRRWAYLFLLRVCAVILVFSTPLILAKAPTYGASWTAVMVAEVALSVMVARPNWTARSRAFFGNGLFVAITCALVVGWSAASSFLWLYAVGSLFAASIVCSALAAGESVRD